MAQEGHAEATPHSCANKRGAAPTMKPHVERTFLIDTKKKTKNAINKPVNNPARSSTFFLSKITLSTIKIIFRYQIIFANLLCKEGKDFLPYSH